MNWALIQQEGSLLLVQATRNIDEELHINEWIETLQDAWKSKLLIMLVIDSWRLLRKVQLKSVSAEENEQKFN